MKGFSSTAIEIGKTRGCLIVDFEHEGNVRMVFHYPQEEFIMKNALEIFAESLYRKKISPTLIDSCKLEKLSDYEKDYFHNHWSNISED
jgi:hypothetical protein